MEEARAVVARLERIEALQRGGADPAALLDELHELALEASSWARAEGDPRAEEAAAACAAALAAEEGGARPGTVLPWRTAHPSFE